MRARLAKDAYSIYCACFPCYNMSVVSDDQDSDYHVQDARRDKRLRHRPSGRPQETSFSTAASEPHLIPTHADPKDLLMAYHVRLGHMPFLIASNWPPNKAFYPNESQIVTGPNALVASSAKPSAALHCTMRSCVRPPEVPQ
jgi:hypothetical protein